MENLYIFFFIAIIILIITNKNKLNEKIDRLSQTIDDLNELLKNNIQNNKIQDNKVQEGAGLKGASLVSPEPLPGEEPVQVYEPVYVPEHEPEPAILTKDESTHTDDHKGTVPEPQLEPESITEDHGAFFLPEDAIINRPIKRNFSSGSTRKPETPELSFFERYPDLEKFIGENLINKIGIAILVMAIGYFVKFAIDNNWVGPAGRVAIGILCGGILVGIAHRMRNSYTAFSSVLVGGGMAIFYFTITLAYHQFHLFDQTTSFIILIVITCFAVLLSLLYDKQELAVIALIGGLSSPFMVSGDHANYNALFIYLIILNTGLLIIAYKKAWRILNITAFALSVIVCALIVFSLSRDTFSTGFCYITILYLMFFIINVIHNIRENKKFIASDFSILLINTALYFGAGLYLLTEMGQTQFNGAFTAGLAVINLVLSWVMFKQKKVDTNILYLLIGITLTFISLTAPIQLHGHYITLFWAAETVLLYWLFKKSGIVLMEIISSIIFVTMLISLVMDWQSIYESSAVELIILANKGFITTIVAALSSYLLYRIKANDQGSFISSEKQISPDENTGVPAYSASKDIYKYIALILFFVSGLLEINHQFLNHYPDTNVNRLYLLLYIPAFVFLYHIASKKIGLLRLAPEISGVMISVCILVYLSSMPMLFHLQSQMLEGGQLSTVHFVAHWIAAIFISLLFYQLIGIVRSSWGQFRELFCWLIAGAIVLFVSLELSLASNLVFYSSIQSLAHIETVYIKSGLPVIWGLLSFAMMWLGMRHKIRTLRIISLSLFSVTLLKLFLFDIRNIPAAGKIAAFFCLGILLLIISFMYQKVKKIIIDDEIEKKE